MKVSVIGLGKLGLCSAACIAVSKINVVGVDLNSSTLDSLNQKKCPIDEPDLPELLDQSWSHLKFTQSTVEAVLQTDLTLIIVPTPSGDNHEFINDYILSSLKEIAQAIKEKDDFHVVDVVSTVMPGTCNEVFLPFLEKETGKTCGQDFGLVYNPEFVALGSVIKNFLNPDMVLIGASDKKSSKIVENLYRLTTLNNPKYHHMSLVNAEITKLSLNCYVTMKISFANELASICEKVPGSNVDDITNALGADKRISSKYLSGGLGFGGPCFPRDNLAFQAFAKKYGLNAVLGTGVVSINNSIVQRLVHLIQSKAAKGSKVSILGLSYKPDTVVIEESQSMMLANELSKGKYDVHVHDPKAIEAAKKVLKDTVSYHEDVYESMQGSQVIVYMTTWNEYQNLDWKRISNQADNAVILIDCWRELKEQIQNVNIVYIPLGVGPVK